MRHFLAVTVTLALLAPPASAVAIKYVYTGETLHRVEGDDQFDPLTLPGFSGVLMLDPSKLGPLAGSTIEFECDGIEGPQCNGVEGEFESGFASARAVGIRKWTLDPTLFSDSRTFARFTFRDDLSMQSYFIDVADGPPDYFMFDDGDIFSFGGFPEWRAPPGVWSDPQIVPLPAASLCLIGGIAGLALVRRGRRAKQAA